MPAATYYRQIRLPILATGDQRSGHRISDELNRVFASVQCCTVLGLEVERVPANQQANTGPAVSLWYRAPYGAPHRAVEFIDLPRYSAAAQADGFFAVNPDLRMLFHADISDRSQRQPRTHLLFIIQRVEHLALRDQSAVAGVAFENPLASGDTKWARNLDGVSADPLVINADTAAIGALVPSLAVYQAGNGGVYSALSHCCYGPLAAIPDTRAVSCETQEVCDLPPPPLTTPPPPTEQPPPPPPTLPPPPPPPPEDVCRYTWVSVVECDNENNPSWGPVTLVDIACIPEDQCPGTSTWISIRPPWAPPVDKALNCVRWYIACSDAGCEQASDCPQPPVNLIPGPPGFPPPPQCCPDVCRYTYESEAECDILGNASWGAPKVVDIACIAGVDCPDNPAWTNQRPAWIEESPRDNCKAWYVVCDPDAPCGDKDDCPDPPPEALKPADPELDIPIECCPGRCRYTWEVRSECDNEGNPIWGAVSLVDTACIKIGDCPENPQWTAQKPEWVELNEDDDENCFRWYVACDEDSECGLGEGADPCPAPPAEMTPQAPQEPAPAACCKDVCRYTWQVEAVCDAEENPSWGPVTLVDTACIKEASCPDEPAWTDQKPAWIEIGDDEDLDCFRWYVACSEEGCNVEDPCGPPPAELVPEEPNEPAPAECCSGRCRYTWQVETVCDAQGNPVWTAPVIVDITCIELNQCPDNPGWTAQKPDWVEVGEDDDINCMRWYVDCDPDTPCSLKQGGEPVCGGNPPAGIVPEVPAQPPPAECCVEVCRYTWEVRSECDNEGNPIWGAVSLVDTRCIKLASCPDGPSAWSNQKPDWINLDPGENQNCIRWYVACDEDSECSEAEPCGDPPTEITPAPPGGNPPAECCDDVCQYIWQVQAECNPDGDAVWGAVELISTKCVKGSECPEEPAWTSDKPEGVTIPDDEGCFRWYIACDPEAECTEDEDCPSPRSEIVPEAPAAAPPEGCCAEVCRYVYSATWNCVQERWNLPQFLDARCVKKKDCPDEAGWTTTRPEGIAPTENDDCVQWHVTCKEDCPENNQCVSPSPPPERPSDPNRQEECCPDTCRYTWVSIAECDSEGNASWGSPSLINTACIRSENCPETPAWTADRPSWVSASADDTCRRWYVACDPDSNCTVNADCGPPPPSITPSTPGGTPPVPPCCTRYCKYTWESTFTCSSGGGFWGEPVLAKKECVNGPCEDKPWTVGEEDSESGDIVGSCSAPCKATTIICKEISCDSTEGEGNGDDCPDPESEDTPDIPSIDPPAFDIFANGRINGCDLPLDIATLNGQPAVTSVGGRNNPNCPIPSHFVATVWSKLVSNVSICDIASYCAQSESCESGACCGPGPECGACSWPCDPDSFGDRISFYLTPAGTVAGGTSPGAFFCGGFTLAGGGSACLSAPGGGC